jgi:hypothetical protein
MEMNSPLLLFIVLDIFEHNIVKKTHVHHHIFYVFSLENVTTEDRAAMEFPYTFLSS